MSKTLDLVERLARAGARIDPRLTDEAVERLVAGVGQRRRRRQVARLGVATAAVMVAALLVGVPRLFRPPGAGAPTRLADQGGAARPPALPAQPPAARVIALHDGSTAAPLDAGSVLRVLEDGARSVRIEIERGGGRFEVVPSPDRSFVVVAGAVSVTVMGTIFTVERDGERVSVGVERGTVRVGWGPEVRVLERGEGGWFPPLTTVSGGGQAGGADGRGSAPPGPVRPARKVQIAVADPVRHPPAGPARPETTEEILAAADAARLAGHAAEGAALLRRVLDEHGNDPRAPLAAFTLGRVLLMELGQPREAAIVFARVGRMAPGGPFAEDALAREVEAWNRAGDLAQARVRAGEYLRLYPVGNRAETVRKLGGLSP